MHCALTAESGCVVPCQLHLDVWYHGMHCTEAIFLDTLCPEDTRCIQKINTLSLLIRNVYAVAATSLHTVP